MHISAVPPEDGTPSSEAFAAWARRANPPDNEVPGVVACTALLGRAEDLAVALIGLQVFSTGVLLGLTVRTRNAATVDLPTVFGGRPGEAAQLLLGVELADGRTITTTSAGPWPPRPDTGVALTMCGGSGSERTADLSLFLTPLPPPGPVRIYCAWPARDITETRTDLDGTLIAAAAAQVQVLWPPEPELPPTTLPPLPPDLPSTGWFAHVLGPDRPDAGGENPPSSSGPPRR